MPELQAQLDIDKCPHCSVDKPSLSQNARFSTTNFAGSNQRFWVAYACSRCGGVVIAASPQEHSNVYEIYPSSRLVNDALAESMRTGQPYQTRLDPPPGPPENVLPEWKPGQPKFNDWPSHIHAPKEVER